MNCYVIWKFAENIDGAKQFLVDLVGTFGTVFQKSEFYNFPCYPATVPDLAGELAKDPAADPPGKYEVLAGALDWATNVGYPGYATAGIDEVFNTFVVPTMFARVARGESSPEDAAAAAQKRSSGSSASGRRAREARTCAHPEGRRPRIRSRARDPSLRSG